MDRHAIPGETVLGLDIGGTKMLAALVLHDQVVDARTMPTPSDGHAAQWCAALAHSVSDWQGRFAQAGVAVTGRVADGMWSALNPATLAVTAGFPLVQTLREALGVPVVACNDAQAAAWGEFRHGAGAGEDLVFVTVSTGLGGGAVVGGRLLTGRGGLGGHIGQIRLASPGGEQRLEDLMAGRAIARQAHAAGHAADAEAVCIAAEAGAPWAEAIIRRAAELLARALADLQLLFDPTTIVLGGGIGLRPSYARHVHDLLAALPAPLRPHLVPAALGRHAGVIGAAALAREQHVTATSQGDQA